MDRRHLYKWNLHAQISAPDHNAFTGLTDLFNIVDTRTVFNLGDHIDLITAMLGQEVLDIQNILFAGNKRGRHKIHAILNPEQKILFVLLAKINLLQNLIGKAHALAV